MAQALLRLGDLAALIAIALVQPLDELVLEQKLIDKCAATQRAPGNAS
jgi:hypothetical protein